MVNVGSVDVSVVGPGNRSATLIATQVPASGLQILNEDVSVTARDGGFAAGEVCMFDIEESESSGAAVGLTEVVQPTARGILGGGIFAVAIAAIADNAVGTVRVRGLVGSLGIAASGSIVPGDALVPTTAGNLDLVTATGEKIIAISRGSLTTPTSAAALAVLFDGVNGFGAGVT